VFQSERFFRETWPTISQALEPEASAKSRPAEDRRQFDDWTPRIENVFAPGGLDGTPFSLDAPRLVLVARK
jgi:hypothetical protein